MRKQTNKQTNWGKKNSTDTPDLNNILPNNQRSLKKSKGPVRNTVTKIKTEAQYSKIYATRQREIYSYTDLPHTTKKSQINNLII